MYKVYILEYYVIVVSHDIVVLQSSFVLRHNIEVLFLCGNQVILDKESFLKSWYITCTLIVYGTFRLKFVKFYSRLFL